MSNTLHTSFETALAELNDMVNPTVAQLRDLAASPPLILGAWWHTSDAEKQSRFLSHIQWAAEHDALPKIAIFIKSLTPEQWHYEGQ